MSVSGFSSASPGKDPRRFCEGDHYRGRTEVVATSGGGGFLRGPLDRRFQTNGKMPPQMTYRESRDWHGSSQTPEQHSTGYHTMGHPNNDAYDGGYGSTGHLSNVPEHHMSDAYPLHDAGHHYMGHPIDVLGYVNETHPPSSRHEDPYIGHPIDVPGYVNETHPPSSRHEDPYIGHPNHDPMHLNSYPRHSEGYPHSGRPFNQHSLLGHPSNTMGPSLSQSNEIPQQNGFADELSSRHLGPSSSSSTAHPPSSHHSSSNGPLTSRDYWPRGMKPHPPQDHAHRPPPHLLHDGDPGHYLQAQPDASYNRPAQQGSSNYRHGPESHRSLRSDSSSSSCGPEANYWRNPGGSGVRERGSVSVSGRSSQPTGGWETGDPRPLPQRRPSDSNMRKNFVSPTTEEWRHNHMSMDRSGSSYSPSISSQCSWSPGLDETSSPRLRMPPQQSPSTPDDFNNPAPDFHVDSHHHHPHHPQYHTTSSDPQSSVPYNQGGFDKDKAIGRGESGLLKAPDGGRMPKLASSPAHGKGGKVGKEERRLVYSRGPPYHDRRAPAIMNGLSVGSGQLVRDPRQAGFTRSKRGYKIVAQEHSYSKKYQEGGETHPRFHRIEPCSTLSPDLLTELRSSAAKSKAARRASNSGSSTTKSKSQTGSAQSVSRSEQKPPASAGTPSTKFEQSSRNPSNTDKQLLVQSSSSSLEKSVTNPSGSVKPTTSSEKLPPLQSKSSLEKKQGAVQLKPATSPMISGTQPALKSTSVLRTRGANSSGTVKPTASSVSASTLREPPAIQTQAAPCIPPQKLMAPGKAGKMHAQTQAHQVREAISRKADSAMNGSDSSEIREFKRDTKEKTPTPLGREPLDLHRDFFLDLDPEPTSGSNSNSTCCSESEEQTESRTEDSDMEVEGADQETTETADEQPTLVDDAQTSDEESLTMSLPGSPRGEEKKSSPEQWLVSLPEPGKMRFSRLDNIGSSSDSERLSVKQMTSNRIQLRNGRVLPASHLAYQAKFTSPPSSSDTPTSPASSSSSPQKGRLRRSKRLAASNDALPPQLWGMFPVAMDSDSTADQSFEMQLSEDASSDESEFDLPDFTPKPSQTESQQHKASSSSVGRGARGRRGRGRGGWARRGGVKRGGGGGPHVPTKSSAEDLPSSSGVQFYDHKPRTREEDGILQRRLALEMEVKRNERIQSEQSDLTTQPFKSTNIKNTVSQDEDRGSVVSESFPTSTSSLESLHHSQTSSSSYKTGSQLSTDFSPDLIAQVKKIATARSSGDTPLHKCCRTGKYDMVRYLLTVDNVPVNVQDNAGWTPLHEATSNGHVEVAELLLQHGADSNACARDGTRPIHDAIEIGNMDMVRLLVERGADLLVEYGERTAVEFARDQNQLEIADYIKDVIHTRQEKKKAIRNSAHHHQKTTPTRSSRKEKLLKQCEHQIPRIPVNGYGPGSVSFGEELDYPLFYVLPVIELSTKPHLPVYNFQISPPGTFNPRRHNFYLMDNLLKTLGLTEEEFIAECHDVNILELTVAEFLHRMKISPYNLQVSVPEKIKALPKKQAIKFVPLCRMLANMLDVLSENMDN